MKNIEREFKWDAAPRGAFRHFVAALKQVCNNISAPQQIRNTDVYLQDGAGTFARRKMALRIRRTAGRYEATLKGRSAVKRGLAVRQEWTCPLPGARSVPGALHELQQKRTWHGVALDGLKTRFSIYNQRTVYRVRYGRCVCEAALDNYVTCVGGQRWRRKEIELELKTGPVYAFDQLTKELSARSGLGAAQVSKVVGAEQWMRKLGKTNL